MNNPDQLWLRLTGNEPQEVKSPGQTATNLIYGTAGAYMGLRYFRASKIGRQILGKGLQGLYESRLARTVQHLGLPYQPADDMTAPHIAAIPSFRGDQLEHIASLREIRSSGVGNLGQFYRAFRNNILEREILHDAAQPKTFGERITREADILVGATREYSRKVKEVWSFYGSPLAQNIPSREAPDIVRFASEALQAARLTAVNELQAFSPQNIRKALEAPELGASQAQALKRLLQAWEQDPAMTREVLDVGRVQGLTAQSVTQSMFERLLDLAQRSRMFHQAPEVGGLETAALGKSWKPETLGDFLSGHTGPTVRYRFQTDQHMGVADIPVDILRKLDPTMYTGRMLGPDSEVWDPRRTTISRFGRDILQGLGSFVIPVAQLRPAWLFFPKSQVGIWGDEAPFVESLSMGRQVAVRSGKGPRSFFGMGPRTNLYNVYEPRFDILSTGRGESFEAQLESRARGIRGASVITRMGALDFQQNLIEYSQTAKGKSYKELMPDERARLRTQFIDMMYDEERTGPIAVSQVPHSLLRRTLSWSDASRRPIGKTFASDLELVEQDKWLIPRNDYMGRAINMVQGRRTWTPLSDDQIIHAIAGKDIEFGPMGEPHYKGHATGFQKFAAGTVKLLSKVGIDWRQQRIKPVPWRIMEGINWILTGQRQMPLHLEDWIIDPRHLAENVAEHATSAYIGKWGGFTSQHAMDILRRQEMNLEDLSLSVGARVIRTTAGPVGRHAEYIFMRKGVPQEVAETELIDLIQAISRRAHQRGDEALLLNLSSPTKWESFGPLGLREIVSGPRIPLHLIDEVAEQVFSKSGLHKFQVLRAETAGHKDPAIQFTWRTTAKNIYSEKAEWMAVSPEIVPNSVWTWVFHRPLELMNVMGVGGHDETQFRNWRRVNAAFMTRLAGLFFGAQALRYLDYAAEEYTGVSPWKAGVGLFAGVDIARRGVTQPIGKGLEFALGEETVKSPGFYGAKFFGPLAAGILTARMTGKPLYALAGLGVSGLLAGDLTIGPRQMFDIYSGEEPIPIRRARWWGLSRGPFWGGDITHFRPHWVARQFQEPMYAGYPYASKRHYWQTQPWLPVPENWFGSRGFLRPYEHDEYLQQVGAPTVYSSAHPITRIPLWGPLLQPIGAVLKPPRRMHPDIPLPQESAQESAAREVFTSIAQRQNLELMEEGLTGLGARPEGPYSVRGMVREFTRFAEELPGIYGFSLLSIPRHQLGLDEPGAALYETAEHDVSARRRLWEHDLGGLFGATEGPRRLVPKWRYGIQTISNIPSGMPSWLPGAGDMSGKWYDYGNPFAQLHMAEHILPGPGYATRYPELRGLTPERYPAWARLEILTSAAPFSRQARTAAQELGRQPTLSPREQRILEQYHTMTGDPVYIRGEQDSPVSLMFGLRPSKLGTGEPTLLRYVSNRLLGPTIQEWEFPVEHYVKPTFRMVGYSGDPGHAVSMGAATGFVMGGGNLVTTVFGATIAGALGIHSQIRADQHMSQTGDVWVPEDTRQRWEITEYIDKLRFVKSLGLYRQTGDSIFLEAASRTLYGLDPFEEHWRVMSALPAGDRQFVAAFLQVQDSKERQEILSATPDYIDRILGAQWALRDSMSGRLSQAELEDLERLKMASHEESQSRLFGETAGLEEYFGDYYLPPESWSGWSIDSPIEAAAYKIIENEGLAKEEFDIWQTDLTRFNRLRNSPTLPPVGTPTPMGVFGARRRLRELLHPSDRYYESMTVLPSTREGYSGQIEIDRSGYREVRAMLRYGL